MFSQNFQMRIALTAVIIIGILGFHITSSRVFCIEDVTKHYFRTDSEWTVPVTVSISSQGDRKLVFGTKKGATDGLDPGIDILSPPPPQNMYDAYFKIDHPIFPNLSHDFRSPDSASSTWNLIISATKGQSGVISWDATNFPTGKPSTSRLVIMKGNTILADMLSEDSLDFSGDQDLLISFYTLIDTLKCELSIIEPQDGDLINSDSVTVKALATITGGIPLYDVYCYFNGFLAKNKNDALYSTIPLDFGENSIVAKCVVTDSLGTSITCFDSLKVFRYESLTCRVEITSPTDSGFTCKDSIEVKGIYKIIGGVSPFKINCVVNGFSANTLDSTFFTTIPLLSGENQIIANCTVLDSLNSEASCLDSIIFILDDIPPSVNYDRNETGISGTFIDNESGIASINPTYLYNVSLYLTPDPFPEGIKEVNFRLEAIDPNNWYGFTIVIKDRCGNTTSYDPILTNLSFDDANKEYSFSFPGSDRYFHITNYGLKEIIINLNENEFELTSDLNKLDQDLNCFQMPKEGSLSIDMNSYLLPTDNIMRISIFGEPGTKAQVMISNFKIDTENFFKLDLFPVKFSLAQNYPNPFNSVTNLCYVIPEQSSQNIKVKLYIYNLLGKLIKTLVDEEQNSGQHTVQWDGRNDSGNFVSSGIYIYYLSAGKFKGVNRMILLK